MTKNELRFEKIERIQDMTIQLTEATEVLMAYYLILRENSEFDYEKEAIEARADEKIKFIDELKQLIKSLKEVKTEKQLTSFDKEFGKFSEKYEI